MYTKIPIYVWNASSFLVFYFAEDDLTIELYFSLIIVMYIKCQVPTTHSFLKSKTRCYPFPFSSSHHALLDFSISAVVERYTIHWVPLLYFFLEQSIIV